MKTLFQNALIVTVNNTNDVFKGNVVVEDNLITYVGTDYVKCDKVIDCTGKLLMPGFVNAHSHAYMSLFRNLGENTTFKDWWYDVMRPLEENSKVEHYELGITLALMEMIRNGITTFADVYMNPEITAKVATKYGVRLNVGVGAITGSEVLTQKSLANDCAKIAKINKDIKPMLYAHSIYSCSEDQFAELIKFAKANNLVLTTHLSETLDEVGKCLNDNGVTPAEYLESLGFFDNTHSILAHCVHCDKDDVRLLAQYDTYVASNPSSNLILGSGIAPIYSFINNNLPVCLGTDGAGSNNSLDMFKEMYLLDNLQAGVLNQAKAVTCTNTVRCATVNGAKALGYNNLGVIAKGYLADIILVDLKTPNMQPLNDCVSALVNSANCSNVCLTMVNGKVLYQDGKYAFDINLDKLYNDCNKAINSIRGIAN